MAPISSLVQSSGSYVMPGVYGALAAGVLVGFYHGFERYKRRKALPHTRRASSREAVAPEQSAGGEGGAEMMYELNEAAKAAQELESTQGRV